MNIGEAAKLTGLSDKTLRYYESIGLVSAKRSSNGYRLYTDKQVDELHFLASARQTGFTLDECKALLALLRDTNRHSRDVKAFVTDKLTKLDSQIAALSKMKQSLEQLSSRCNDNDDSQCAIIEGLSSNTVCSKEENNE